MAGIWSYRSSWNVGSERSKFIATSHINTHAPPPTWRLSECERNLGNERNEKKRKIIISKWKWECAMRLYRGAVACEVHIYLMVLTFVSFVRFWLLIFVSFTLWTMQKKNENAIKLGFVCNLVEVKWKITITKECAPAAATRRRQWWWRRWWQRRLPASATIFKRKKM